MGHMLFKKIYLVMSSIGYLMRLAEILYESVGLSHHGLSCLRCMVTNAGEDDLFEIA